MENPKYAKHQYKTPLSFDLRWGKPGKTLVMPKININQHKIKISDGENWGNPNNCFDLQSWALLVCQKSVFLKFLLFC